MNLENENRNKFSFFIEAVDKFGLGLTAQATVNVYVVDEVDKVRQKVKER